LYGAGERSASRLYAGEKARPVCTGDGVAANLGDGEALEQREVRLCAERGGVAYCWRDETCPVSTGGGTRRVQLVREEGRGASSQYGREGGGGAGHESRGR